MLISINFIISNSAQSGLLQSVSYNCQGHKMCPPCEVVHLDWCNTQEPGGKLLQLTINQSTTALITHSTWLEYTYYCTNLRRHYNWCV